MTFSLALKHKEKNSFLEIVQSCWFGHCFLLTSLKSGIGLSISKTYSDVLPVPAANDRGDEGE